MVTDASGYMDKALVSRVKCLQSEQRAPKPHFGENIRLSSDVANPLRGTQNYRADGDGCVEFPPDAGVAQRLKGVTVCTIGDEPWRGSLSDRILIAENRCTALFVSTGSPTRKPRRGSVGALLGARADCISAEQPVEYLEPTVDFHRQHDGHAADGPLMVRLRRCPPACVRNPYADRKTRLCYLA